MAKLSPLMLAPPLIFAGLAAMFWFGMQRDDPDQLPSALEGRQAPAVVVEQLGADAPFADADLRAGEVTLVNFWASWCAPCRVEHPQLMALAAEGLAIYGINYKDDSEKALAFLDELGDPYVGIGADSLGRTAIDWGVYGVPETFVIDGQGRIVLRFAGPITGSILEKRIRPAIASASGTQ